MRDEIFTACISNKTTPDHIGWVPMILQNIIQPFHIDSM